MLINTSVVAIGFFIQVCLATDVKGVTKLNFNIKNADADVNSPVVKKLLKRADAVSPVFLKDWLTYFSINATIGTPEQEFELLLGTSFSDTFVLGKGNKYCTSSTRLNKRDGEDLQKRADSESSSASGSRTVSEHPSNSGYDYVPYASATYDCIFGQFDEEASESLKKNTTGPLFQLGFAGTDSVAQGEWATDKFKLGGFEVDDFSFGIAEQATFEGGILGLGLEEAETTNMRIDGGENYTYENFPTRLKNGGHINKKVFSLYADSFNSTTGSILFGGVDHAKYTGDLVTVPMVNQYEEYGIGDVRFFDISLTGVGTDVNGNRTTFSTDAYAASVDASTTLTYLPSRFVEEIAESLGASYSSLYGFYTMICPTLDESLSRFLVLDFQGSKISIPLYQLIRIRLDELCVLSILESYDGISATLGTAFFRSAYVVFDLEDKEISIAQIKYTEDENIEAVESSIPSATQAPKYSSSWSTYHYPTSTGDIFESDEGVTSKADVFGYTGGVLDETVSLRSTTTSTGYSGYSRSSRYTGYGGGSATSSRRTSTTYYDFDTSEVGRSTSFSGSNSNSGVVNPYVFKRNVWIYFSSFLVVFSLVALL